MQPTNQTDKVFKIGAAGAIIVLLAIAVTCLVLQQKSASEAKALQDRVASLEATDTFPEKEVAKDRYQAVFLTNGQVYFGKLTKTSKDTVKIEDIFYLASGSLDKDQVFALTKLGDELHAPDDAMVIERKQLMFWENLKADGKVAKSIADYKKAH